MRETIVYAAPAPRALPAATETKIRALLNAPEMQSGHVGLLISALGTADTPQTFPAAPYDDKAQPVLFANDADKRFLPASNMKLFTSAMALKVLGPDKTFTTKILRGGFNNSDIALQGGGDPSFDVSGVEDLAHQIANKGITKAASVYAMSGPIKAETFGGRYPEGWTLDDTLWYYGAKVSGLAFERNQIDLLIEGDVQSNRQAKVTIEPDGFTLGGFKAGTERSSGITSEVVTGSDDLKTKSEDELISIESRVTSEGLQGLHVSGHVAPRQKITLGLAVPQPEFWAGRALVEKMRNAGIAVSPLDVKFSDFLWTPKPFQEIARHESPPVKELLKRLLKNSDNLYAEMMLRNAALYSLPENKRAADMNYARRGHQLIFDWLKENNIPTAGLSFTDGSGLSRYDMVTPRAISGVLSAVEKVPGAQHFWDALPIAGVDGTMRNREKGTPGENNVRAKSGTFSIVSCLSGYVTTKDKQRLSVVILTNFADGTAARKMQDDIFVALAEADFGAR